METIRAYGQMRRKLDAQTKELARMTRELEGVRNDLADIKDQRDRLKDFVRKLATPSHGSDPTTRDEAAKLLAGL